MNPCKLSHQIFIKSQISPSHNDSCSHSRWHLNETPEEVIDKMRKGQDPIPTTVVRLLKLYQHDRAKIEDLTKIIQNGRPNIIVFDGLISTWGKLGDLEKVTQLLEQLNSFSLRPTDRLFNSLIHIFGRKRDFQAMNRILLQMHHYGFKPNLYTFTTMIANFAKINDEKTILMVRNQMERLGMKPNQSVFNVLFDYYGKKGDKDSIDKLNQEMAQLELSPSPVGYNTLLSYFGKKNDLDTVAQLRDEMKTKQIKPDLVTYATLIDVYHNRPDLVEEVVSESSENDWSQKDRVGYYNVLLKHYGKLSNLKRTIEIHEEMKKNEVLPDKFTFVTLITTYMKLNQLERVEELLVMLRSLRIAPELPLFNTLLNYFGKLNRFDDVQLVIDEMGRQKVNLDSFSYNILILHRGREDLYAALNLKAQMDQKNMTDACTYITLMSHFKTHRNSQMMRTLWTELLQRKLPIKKSEIESASRYFASIGDLEMSSSVLATLQNNT
eukprot:TRINITY_DN2564_c0_g1_i1.p1 TRINITY_DN2564_c0_g1~~TRINITY_DN2564_c0_g1_i1.p1  ORF type:complete len:495 (+),score=128.11 TRINITY_DN2564_c0_g1_i1:209-1693(+)